MTYSDPKVTYIDPTHLLLPLPASPGPYWAESWRFRDLRWVVVVVVVGVVVGNVYAGRQAPITSQLARHTRLQHMLVAQNVLWQAGLEAGIAAQQNDE